MENQNKSITYSINTYEGNMPNSMPSSQKYTTSNCSNILFSDSSSLQNENHIPVTYIPQTGILLFIII